MTPLKTPVRGPTLEKALWALAATLPRPGGNGDIQISHQVGAEGPEGLAVELSWWIDYSWDIEAGGGGSDAYAARLLVRRDAGGFAVVAVERLT